MSGERLASALSLVAMDLRVFPLQPEGWTPAHKGWQQEATTDPIQVFDWWSEADYNIGVATGQGILVVDVDDKPGKNGSESLDALGVDPGALRTFTVRTPTGGRHLYFFAPDVANTASRLAPDIDIRSNGGYVVGPGSYLPPGTKNAQGGVYQAVNGAVIGDAPPLILSRLSAASAAKGSDPVSDLDTPDAIDRAASWLSTAEAAVEGQGGDDTTFRVASKVKDFGVSEAAAYGLLVVWNEQCVPPWDEADLRQKVANAFAYGKQPPGVDHPQHTFQGVDVVPQRAVHRRQWFRHGDDWKGSVRWLYRGMLPYQGVAVMTAPSGAGKTFVALGLAQSLESGEPFFGVEPKETGGTLYLVGEAYGSMKQRLAALGEGRRAVYMTYVGGLAARGAWGELCEDVKDAAAEILAEHGKQVRVIVLDTLSASAILENEDDNAQAATVMRMFADLSVSMGCLFLVIHHPPKSGTGARGAGAIVNNADYVLEIEQTAGSPVRRLHMTKSRDGETREIGSFTLTRVEIGVEDDEEITTMMVNSTAARAAVSVEKARKLHPHMELVRECVEWALVESPIMVDNLPMAEQKAVFEVFKERFPNQRAGRANIHAALRKMLVYLEDTGVLEQRDYLGRKYIKMKEYV